VSGSIVAKQVTRTQYETVKELLRTGKSINQIHKDTKLAYQTVRSIALRTNLYRPDYRMFEAQRARQVYTRERRLQILDRAFEVAETILEEGVATPQQLQQFTAALGQLIEKHRLEDGDTTSSQELVLNNAREQARQKLTTVVQRRTQIKLVSGDEANSRPVQQEK
jgi:hypothetical protein